MKAWPAHSIVSPVLDRRRFLGKLATGLPLLIGVAAGLSNESLASALEYPSRTDAAGSGYANGITLAEASVMTTVAARPDYELVISPMSLEIAPGKTITTVGYCNQIPGPVIRLREGAKTTIKVVNRTDHAEIVHWHGLRVPSNVDGAVEEGTPMVPPNQARSYTFVAQPAGTRWYHTHAMAGKDLTRSLYTGQYGFLYIENRGDPGRYDREVFIAVHQWEPSWVLLQDLRKGPPPNNGFEVAYGSATFNDKALGHGEPIRVRQGQRILFRLLNASATDEVTLALPGHHFEVVALDGNAVPVPSSVDTLFLAPGERIDAIVEMDRPGVWIFGAVPDELREKGMGVVVEYANATGKPRWEAPRKLQWDYTVFGARPEGAAPDQSIELLFEKIPGGRGGFNRWTINGKSWPDTDPIVVQKGRRYRLGLHNFSGDLHPIHLHRHTLEIATFMGKPSAGIRKDVVALGRRQSMEVDFTADDPGASLLHCHMQDHQDFGFMSLVQYA